MAHPVLQADYVQVWSLNAVNRNPFWSTANLNLIDKGGSRRSSGSPPDRGQRLGGRADRRRLDGALHRLLQWPRRRCRPGGLLCFNK